MNKKNDNNGVCWISVLVWWGIVSLITNYYFLK